MQNLQVQHSMEGMVMIDPYLQVVLQAGRVRAALAGDAGRVQGLQGRRGLRHQVLPRLLQRRQDPTLLLEAPRQARLGEITPSNSPRPQNRACTPAERTSEE